MATRIGEVIEARSGEFMAECYELHQAPPLGSLVKAGSPPLEIYGVVCDAATESLDPGRRPLARGREEDSEEDIYRHNPQLAKLLRTTFQTVVVGHLHGKSLRHYLPPQPSRVHSFVYLCELDEVRRFTASLDFLGILLSNTQGFADEIVAASLRYASQSHPDSRDFLVSAGKTLAVLLRGDLVRLDTILRRIKP